MFDSSKYDPIHHDVSAFDCGKPRLNDWLHDNAARDQSRSQCRVWVWTEQDATEVIAFYAIAPHQDLRANVEVTNRFHRGYAVIPGYLLTRMGLDRSLHGQGLGPELVYEAGRAALAAGRTAGGRAFYVDALDDEAVEFYVRHGFTATAVPKRLMMRLDDIAATLGEAPLTGP